MFSFYRTGRDVTRPRDLCFYAVFGLLLIALGSCGSSGPEDPKQVELRSALKELSAEAGLDRRQAATRLEKLLPPANQAKGLAADAIKTLRTIVADDRDDHVRAAAIRTLGVAKDSESWAVIAERASNEEAQVRSEVIQALRSIDSVKAQPLILAALDDKVASVQQIAASTLVQDQFGIETLIKHLDEKSPHFRLAITVLADCPSESAQKALLAGLNSRSSVFLQAGIRAAGKLQHQAALPQLTNILAQVDDRKVKCDDDVVQAAAVALLHIGGKEALTTLLSFSAKSTKDRFTWMEELLASQNDSLRPIVLAQVSAGTQRVIPQSVLVHFLLKSPQVADLPALAELALPEEPQLVDLCKTLQGAAPEIRALVATRLRAYLADGKVTRGTSDASRALGYVGQVGTGPDVELLSRLFRQVHDDLKGDDTRKYSHSRSSTSETVLQKKERETRQQKSEELIELRRDLGFACLRLKAPGLDAIYHELLNSPKGIDPVGLQGILQSGDIEAVNQALCRLGSSTSASTPHLWTFLENNTAILDVCHDARLVPGLTSLLKRKQEQGRVCRLIMKNGTREAALVLIAKLKDPETPVSFKRDTLYPLMPQFGAAGRPIFIDALLNEPPPAKRGDPDLGWWCADFLRVQGDDAVADLLAAISTAKPKGHIAARFIQALELATSAPAVDALLAWVSDTDKELANNALNALIRQQRSSAVPALKILRGKTPEGQWRNRLDLAISTLTPTTK